jgi:hypothetical protein
MKSTFSLFGRICQFTLFSGLIMLCSSLPLAAQPLDSSLRINEFMASNSTTLADEDGDYSDWIEIYNPTAAAIDLLNWSLTDDKASPQKWQFPQVSLAANSYLVVFASGKDRALPGQELHMNFKLSGTGEYLALSDPNGTVATVFDPSFPEQQPDVSFAYYEGDFVASSSPTPGAVNQFADQQVLPSPVFDHEHGFYETPFEVAITSELAAVQIYYTTDGSEPSDENGIHYSAPLPVHTTTVLRAIAMKSGYLKSRITTRTYLFLDDVIKQPNNPPGYPSEWGPYLAFAGTSIADYEMDPEITQDPEYANLMRDALLAIPTISIVTDKNNLFSKSTDPDLGGIYIYTGPPGAGDVRGLGNDWERPASVEFFNADGSESFQADCGIRLHGGHSRRPEKCPKHSFRLVFRKEYGPTRLDYPILGNNATSSFNSIILRAGFGNTWVHWSSSERQRAQLIRDIWGKDTQLDMGHLSGHNSYAHVYLNGLYWGLFNPTERIDDEFATTYMGGNPDDYDVIKFHTTDSQVVIVDGNLDAWRELFALARQGLASNENYQRIQGKNPDGSPNPNYKAYLDVVNFIDYMLLNFYGNNWDWDHHNGIVVRNRINPGKGFKFISWDAEHILEDVSRNRLQELGENPNNNCPSELFQRLRQNAEFRRLVADRVQFLCFNGGILTPESAAQRWMERAREIDLPIIAESARWGDYRRDVHQYQSGPFDLYTKKYWLDEQSFIMNDYFPDRTTVFIDQLKQASLFPRTTAPRLLINGQETDRNTIQAGDVLTMTAPSGTIYYTTDGADPWLSESSGESGQSLLVTEDAAKKVLVPKTDIGNAWRSDIHFDDSAWQLCSGTPGGVGYEKGSGYEDLITLDVGDDMHDDGGNPNPSCYIRIVFNVTDENLQKFNALTLQALYDDGFVAYLNNTKVAEANAPASPVWNSVSTAGHEAAGLESFDISQYISKLVEGQNLLAIQGLNANTSSSDFIFNGQLLADEQISGGEEEVSPSAVIYSEPITLSQSTHIKARTHSGNEWSALNDMIFVLPTDLDNLKITEIQYHPLAQDSIDDRSFEFIELKNVSSAPLDLSGARFCRGISYSFPVMTILESNKFVVLASDQARFAERYGFSPFGQYDGFLDNAGERLALVNADNDTILSVRYNDRPPWPTTPDGEGYSLVPKDRNPLGDQNDPANWQASHDINGSPGRDDEASTLVNNKADKKPIRFQLDQNYPNPFNSSTTFSYHLPADMDVRLVIFDIVGRTVRTFRPENQLAGSHHLVWNGTNESGNPVASGVYFFTLYAKNGVLNFVQTRKMVLIK